MLKRNRTLVCCALVGIGIAGCMAGREGEEAPPSADGSAIQGTSCTTVNEHDTLKLSCPSGQLITSITFASYGTPEGSCGSFHASTCDASSSKSVVEKACVGKASCTVLADNAIFGDPCRGTFKRLSAQAVCSGSGTTGSGGGTTGSGGGTAGSGGGTAGSGGSGGGTCPTLAERVRISTVQAKAPIPAIDEYHPVVLSPIPTGGARIAYRERDKLAIHVLNLDAQDKAQGELPPFEGEEVHALVAHDDGGAMMIVRNDPDIYSSKYCRGASTPNNAYCAKMDLVRFDASGHTSWTQTLTNKKNVDSDGARFIWWYQHSARLVFADGKYGAYFRMAGSFPRPNVPGEVDIHAADDFRFVGSDGAALSGGWDWGCSHSWSVRLAFNGHWGAACHGDAYPNAFRLAIVDPDKVLNETLLQDQVDPSKRTLGGLVPRSDGFWLSYTAPESSGATANDVHLAAIKNDGTVSDKVISGVKGVQEVQSRLADYGKDRMLTGWKVDGVLRLAVLDRTTGAVVEGPVEVKTAAIDDFQDFVSFPSGDVAWVSTPGDSTAINVVRVTSCP